MVKSLVTGAAGFIGSHVVDELIRMGHSVVALDDLSGGFRENVNQSAEFIEGSVTDEKRINRIFAEHRPDYVYHLAAYAAEGLSHFIKRFNYTNNLIGSINLINASVNAGCVKCFVFTSSIAVYGAGQVPMSEEMVPQPEDPYGISKYAVELDLKETHEMFGMDYIVFRPHNVYGERQNIGDPYRNVIGIFMNQILQEKPLTVFGDGQQTRAFSHIDDVAPIIAQCVKNRDAYNQVFNIGADQPYSVLELAGTVQRSMGVNAEIQLLAARNEVEHAFSSHEKIQQAFPELIRNIPLDEGISRMTDWVKQAGARQGKPFGNIEVEKNMPASWAAFTS
ncbi:MAG: NAD-dependent epimerase/dehydratase family protein [Kiritimatiellae bacterium]|nr:NAD-dependent epimerase/dehydratase family protein [Kiritimatiellia bacterium]MDD4734688.1 NAD-dependent epimerase/dehydratase family protein [Kiritimatiellia bacterium]